MYASERLPFNGITIETLSHENVHANENCMCRAPRRVDESVILFPIVIVVIIIHAPIKSIFDKFTLIAIMVTSGGISVVVNFIIIRDVSICDAWTFLLNAHTHTNTSISSFAFFSLWFSLGFWLAQCTGCDASCTVLYTFIGDDILFNMQ